MIDENLMYPSFQTFFISTERSNCPLISNVIITCKKFKEMGLLKDTTGIVSLSYGKRILINGSNADLKDIKREDILEIVDYDPAKKIVLAIGRIEPHIETPVHWIIQHARNDVKAIIQLNGEKIIERFSKYLPVTEKEYPPGTLELAKEILKMLRKSKRIAIKDRGVLFVGASLKEVNDLILKTYEEYK